MASRHFLSAAASLRARQLLPRLALRRQPGWPPGSNFIHNVPAIRTISFTRVLPKLATKLIRIPAMAGGATVAGLAYIQYQATQAGTYAMDVLNKAGDTVTGTATSLFGSARDIAGQTWTGIERTRESAKDLELPGWMTNMFGSDGGGSGSSSSGGDGRGPGKEPPKQSKSNTAAAAATGAALGYSQSPEDDPRSREQAARDDSMMLLTKKMIQIRNILSEVGRDGSLTLPSIVVIGGQSSGKSSVLEAIVGHEFLPKGSNMVTRRPIELTLVNEPGINTEYGEFAQLGLGKITDFTQIQRTLTDLNLAISDEECVSDDPIRLSIHSPNVPDLSLIDLPGYIRVAGINQPEELRKKISDLCDKYIQPPNIILAISSAENDLAISEALRASKRVDPRGERTIGVITKMDLVPPELGSSRLNNKNYPLRLGYIGVISKVPQQTGLFTRNTGNITSVVTKNEAAYFRAHDEFSPELGLALGTTTLRTTLMHVLQQTMAQSLISTTSAIKKELEVTNYEFKRKFSDRPISADAYLAETLDAFKHAFKDFTKSFGRPQIRELLKAELDQKVLDILANRYWNEPVKTLTATQEDDDSFPLSSLPKTGGAEASTEYWARQVDLSAADLTELGIGQLATNVTANTLQTYVEDLIAKSKFASHPFARNVIMEAAFDTLNRLFFETSKQVENSLKPFRHALELGNRSDVDINDRDWLNSRNNAAVSLKEELRECEAAQKAVSEVIGRRNVKGVLAFIDRVRSGETVLEGNGSGGAGGFSAALLEKGLYATFLRDRADILRMRLRALQSRSCSTVATGKYKCPEVFLDAVADKLTSTAVLFLNVELLSEFYANFPRELDKRLGKGLSDKEVERFAREDKKTADHLDIMRKKKLLELVLDKCESLKGIEAVSVDDRPRIERTGRRR